MGTRADLYVGRGLAAEWLGSIAYDGYPDSEPRQLLDVTDEQHFRDLVTTLIASKDHGTKPEQGWPWPWPNSRLTDYSYAFDDGRVVVTRIGLTLARTSGEWCFLI